jgi:hypothetical protein
MPAQCGLSAVFLCIVSWLPSPIAEYGNEPIASVLFNYLESRETYEETWSQIKRALRCNILHSNRPYSRLSTQVSRSRPLEFHRGCVGVMMGWAFRMVSG